MKHTEKRANLFYAVLTVPHDVRHILGKLRFVKSTGTADKAEAPLRVAFLVDGWRKEIAQARGTLPDPKAAFWVNLRRDYLNAQDEGTQVAIEGIAEAAARKITDPAEASLTYRIATGQAPELIQDRPSTGTEDHRPAAPRRGEDAGSLRPPCRTHAAEGEGVD